MLCKITGFYCLECEAFCLLCQHPLAGDPFRRKNDSRTDDEEIARLDRDQRPAITTR